MSTHMQDRTGTCQVCGQTKPHRQLRPASVLRPAVEAFVANRVPNWTNESLICLTCLNRLRTDFVRAQMEEERGELSALEQDVLSSIQDRELLVDNVNKEYESRLTLGERIADKVADFGGSWRFILFFFVVFTTWIALNASALFVRPFDPYPFILLNLVLSLLAAIQAPVIMMSQNRQEARDRLRAESDYKVNLKAEIEIRTLNEKMDQLLHNQWVRLLEIQQIQMEMLDDLAERQKR
jgi:uncharacterized membrane protein